ncbi:MAG TPA: pantoate--beta-alanine ligase [Stellaceae bacterium]|nr:pantoate--beta-alanine ligase [Stellaceae bacterium]
MDRRERDGSGGIAVVRSIAALRESVDAWRAAGEKVALVPTMGALHAGHLALVARARALCPRVVATVFVNPAQFGPNEDFARYPRDEAADAAKLAAAKCDLVFAPAVDEMYPPGFAASVDPGVMAERLCGAFRPGHFVGVATVVVKLLLQAGPDIACFGEKDYQQLQIIRRVVRDLDLRVRIEGVPTVREADGLALSSRNAYLSPAERAIAPALHRILTATAARIVQRGAAPGEAAAAAAAELLRTGFAAVDYVAACDAATLEPLDRLDRPGRLLAAVRLGATRLIDNVPLLAEGGR